MSTLYTLPPNQIMLVSTNKHMVEAFRLDDISVKGRALPGRSVRFGPYPAEYTFSVTGPGDVTIGDEKTVVLKENPEIQNDLNRLERMVIALSEKLEKQDRVFKLVIPFMMNPANPNNWPERKTDEEKAIMISYGIETSERL